jgi:hypothetical protein
LPRHGGRRGRAHHDDARVTVERPLELAYGPVDVAERDVRGGVDAIAVVAAPVVLEPAVEGSERECHRLGIVLQQLLVQHAEGGEHPHLLETLRVHDLEPDVPVAVLRSDRLAVSQELEGCPALGVAAEVVAHRSGLRHGVEGRVHDSVAHPPADDVVLAAVDLGPLDAAGSERRIEMTGERVERLVVVVVGVERQETELVHGAQRRLGRAGYEVAPTGRN